MVRAFSEKDLHAIMQIWLDTNIKAHHFISKDYWADHYVMVKDLLPQAELYVYEDEDTYQIEGFIGLTNNYIEGIFVKEAHQSRGIGAELLNYAKQIKPSLRLSVYQKNTRAITFYQRELFVICSENTDARTNEKEFLMTWCR